VILEDEVQRREEEKTWFILHPSPFIPWATISPPLRDWA
jgi:hypothetical protein